MQSLVFLPELRQHCMFLHGNRSLWPFSQGSLLGISPVLNRVHQSSQFKFGVSAPPGFPPGKANGPCAAYTSPNYKDAQRVAFVPNKPPLLNYLNVPLRSSPGPAHRVPTVLWLDEVAESRAVIGRLPWASILSSIFFSLFFIFCRVVRQGVGFPWHLAVPDLSLDLILLSFCH